MRADEVAALWPHLTEAERAELGGLAAGDRMLWRPQPGPQAEAYDCPADIIGYGGAAGGGKTDLALGLALTRHAVTAIFRRESTQLVGIVERLGELLGGRDGYNATAKVWRLPGRRIEFGACRHPGDETRHQGRAKDLLVLDEATNFLEAQARFLMGWVRTTRPGQKCTTLLTFNPPTTAEGQWVISFFAPWLDDKHPNPAQPGELRWFATLGGKDVEVEGGAAVQVMLLQGLVADQASAGGVAATVYTQDRPTAPRAAHGPYPVTAKTDLLVQAREIALRLDLTDPATRLLCVFRLLVKTKGRH